ncbi:glycosyl transferase family 2 protein [Nitzschia inconspicua]|uniref:Glycosyl transferase family 2 protein n=1 Tax=Nitzschia inconspicua TaxID=303405 RepID=A0A9K3Q808_9STRA|nr:glycosyl transferase family 2 protein [Nitzschia inconspicua]
MTTLSKRLFLHAGLLMAATWMAVFRIHSIIATTFPRSMITLETSRSVTGFVENESNSSGSAFCPLLQQRHQQYPLSHSVAICAIQKGGRPYLEEWIDYNKILGFDKIYLYDNSNDFELQNWTYNPDAILDIRHFPGQKKQLPAYRECASRIRREGLHTWVAFLDLDEFLVLKQHNYVFEMIDYVIQQQICKKEQPIRIGGVAVNWYMFDYNDHITYQPLPLTYRFQRREVNINPHVKTIVNMAHYKKPISPHAFSYSGNADALDTNGDVLPYPTWFHDHGPTDVAVLHHMNVKSVEEYHQRCARGRADAIDGIKNKKSTMLPLYCRSPQEILTNFESTAATAKEANQLVMDSTAWDLLVTRMPEKYGNVTTLSL